MKKEFKITLEVSDELCVYDPETGKKTSEEERKDLIKNYFYSLEKIITELGERILDEQFDTELEEYCNEEGELPSFKLEIKENKEQ